MKTETFGVYGPPDDLILREGETIEWYVKYIESGQFWQEKTFLIHADTAKDAEDGMRYKFGDIRILKIDFIGTYQY